MLKCKLAPTIISNKPNDVAFVVACILVNKSGKRIKPIAETRIKNAPKKKNTAVIIPAHNIPAFKPSKTFVKSVKQNVPIG